MGLSCAMVQSAIKRVPYGRVPIELDVHGSAVAFSRDSSGSIRSIMALPCIRASRKCLVFCSSPCGEEVDVYNKRRTLAWRL